MNPTEFMTMVTTRLEKEDRRIDQINGGEGSLAMAMAEELYGDETQYLARYVLYQIKVGKVIN